MTRPPARLLWRPGAPALFALCGVLVMVAGCGRPQHAAQRQPAGALALAVTVFADTGRMVNLRLPPPPARVWLDRVTLSSPRPPEPPLPAALPDTLVPEPGPPATSAAAELRPPILRTPAQLRVPARAARGAAVELEVRVDEHGAVTDAAWSGGNADSALVRAARECALAMRFFPASRGGTPVAVWCRQSFEFGKR